jgi:hypothetical protein
MAVPEANSQHHADRVPLGQLLVDSGLLDAADSSACSTSSAARARRSAVLVDGGYVASSIAMALADQHGGLLKTEYGFAAGRPSATQRTPRPKVSVRCLAAAASRRAANQSLSPLLLASRPAPSEPRESQPDLELAPPPSVSSRSRHTGGR